MNRRSLRSSALVSAVMLVLTLGIANVPIIIGAHAATGIVPNSVQTTSGGVSASPYRFTLSNFNAGSGTNSLLVVGVSANNQYATSVSFGGIPLTNVAFSFYSNDAEFWYLKNPTGTANIVVAMAGPTSGVIGAYALSGVDQAIPIPTVVAKHNTAAGSPAISLTTKYSNSWVLELPSMWGGVTLGSPSCTQQWDVNVPGAITGASSSTAASTPGQVACGWTASGGGDFWDDVAIELHAATATTTTSTSTTATTSTSLSSTSTSTTMTTSTTSVVGGITVYAHRIPATYWDPCFASTCSAGSGPGVTMYVELQDAAGHLIQSGYTNENGYTFTGLNPSLTYYVYPDDCNGCHGSTHNVVFKHWGDGSTVRPRAATAGASLDAWYSCTNGCGGV